MRSARRRHVLRVRSVGCSLGAPRLTLLATPYCRMLAATARVDFGIALCSNSSRTTCTLQVLRAGRTQTPFARYALLGIVSGYCVCGFWACAVSPSPLSSQYYYSR
ncbi:hypothetical protein DVQ57_18820 [Yersinia enterocolitica]|nr:hypothetical protein [Yersinia enterocolitica]